MPKSNEDWDKLLKKYIDAPHEYLTDYPSNVYTIPVDTSMHISRAEMRVFEEEMWKCMTWWQKVKYLFMHKKIRRRYYL